MPVIAPTRTAKTPAIRTDSSALARATRKVSPPRDLGRDLRAAILVVPPACETSGTRCGHSMSSPLRAGGPRARCSVGDEHRRPEGEPPAGSAPEGRDQQAGIVAGEVRAAGDVDGPAADRHRR